MPSVRSPVAPIPRLFGWLASRGPLTWVLIAGLGLLVFSALAALAFFVAAGAVLAFILRHRPGLPGKAQDTARFETFTAQTAQRRTVTGPGEFDLFLDARARAARDVTPRDTSA